MDCVFCCMIFLLLFYIITCSASGLSVIVANPGHIRFSLLIIRAQVGVSVI